MAYKEPNSEKAIEAQRASRRRWYVKNKQRQIDVQMKRRKVLVNRITEYKKGLSCVDCGMTFSDRPECCDFHHIHPDEKEKNLYELVRYSRKAAEAEIEKCVPLCANCHRTRHTK